MKTGEPLLDDDAELQTRKGAPREMSLDDIICADPKAIPHELRKEISRHRDELRQLILCGRALSVAGFNRWLGTLRGQRAARDSGWKVTNWPIFGNDNESN